MQGLALQRWLAVICMKNKKLCFSKFLHWDFAAWHVKVSLVDTHTVVWTHKSCPFCPDITHCLGFIENTCSQGLTSDWLFLLHISYFVSRVFTADNGFLYIWWKLLFVGTVRSKCLTDHSDLYFLFSLFLFFWGFSALKYIPLCISSKLREFWISFNKTVKFMVL